MNGHRAEYLNKFSPAASAAAVSFAGALVERMAARVLVFFVRHASLLRPLGQAGKLQLAQVRPSRLQSSRALMGTFMFSGP